MASTAIRAWRPVTNLDAQFLAGSTMQYSFDPIDEYVLGRVAGGALRVRRQGRLYEVDAGEAVVWNPDQAHAGFGPDGRSWHAEMVILSADALTTLLDCDAPPDLVGVHGEGSRFASAFAALARWSRTGDQLATESALVTLAQSWASVREEPEAVSLRAGSSLRWDARARTVRDLICDELAAQTSLAEMAALVGLGKYQLLRLFEREIGVTPHVVRRRMRLRRAQALIESGLALGEVATMVGFYDQSHLHRNFVRYLGMTPGQYRAAVIDSRR